MSKTVSFDLKVKVTEVKRTYEVEATIRGCTTVKWVEAMDEEKAAEKFLEQLISER